MNDKQRALESSVNTFNYLVNERDENGRQHIADLDFFYVQ